MFPITITIFLITLLIAWGITPLVKRFAKKFDILDKPDSRKIHKGSIPRLGGVSIFISVLAASLLYFLFGASYVPDNHAPTDVFPALLVGATLMLLLGIVDDTRRMRASYKLLFQIAIASLVFLLGFRVEYIRFFDGIYFHLGILSFPFTILWIVGITNAVNLVDGMDGLASGLSFVAFVFISVVAMLFGNYHVAIISLAFCGGLIGFMRYNFHPASIFMGDSGSLFLGFMLSVFSVQAMRNGHMQFSILVSCFILAIPILDTSLAIARRFVKYYVINGTGQKGFVAKMKHILYPDSEHIHHRLLKKNLNQQQVSLLLYAIAIFGGFMAIAFNYLSDNSIILLLTGLFLLVLKFVDFLHYKEFSFYKKMSFPKVKTSSQH